MTEQTVNTLAGLCDYVDQQETGTTMSLRNPNNPDRGYVVMTDATWEAAKTNMAVGLILAATSPTPDLSPRAQVVVWGARDAPQDVLDEYAVLIDGTADQPVTLTAGHPGTEWQAEPVHFVIGRPHLVVATAQALDVDAVRLWVDGEPADMEAADGERAFAVVFAEVRS